MTALLIGHPAPSTPCGSHRGLSCAAARFAWAALGETTGFEDLRTITTQAGDKKSLAVGMAGYLNTLTFNSRHREAVRMAPGFAALVDSIGEPELAVGLLYGAAQANWEAGEVVESRRLAQRIIDLADGDPVMGNFVIGSPLAWATLLRRFGCVVTSTRPCHAGSGRSWKSRTVSPMEAADATFVDRPSHAVAAYARNVRGRRLRGE